MRLFQQGLQLILPPRSLTGKLISGARDGAPEALFGSGHKAQGQLLGYESLDQTFTVYEILLAPAPSPIGQCLREMQGSGLWTCSFPLLTDRLPVPLQRGPNRFQYCAVDSITTSSTRWSMSHSA